MGVNHGLLRRVACGLRVLFAPKVDVEAIDLERGGNLLPVCIVVQEVEDAFPKGAAYLKGPKRTSQFWK